MGGGWCWIKCQKYWRTLTSIIRWCSTTVGRTLLNRGACIYRLSWASLFPWLTRSSWAAKSSLPMPTVGRPELSLLVVRDRLYPLSGLLNGSVCSSCSGAPHRSHQLCLTCLIDRRCRPEVLWQADGHVALIAQKSPPFPWYKCRWGLLRFPV